MNGERDMRLHLAGIHEEVAGLMRHAACWIARDRNARDFTGLEIQLCRVLSATEDALAHLRRMRHVHESNGTTRTAA